MFKNFGAIMTSKGHHDSWMAVLLAANFDKIFNAPIYNKQNDLGNVSMDSCKNMIQESITFVPIFIEAWPSTVELKCHR